MRSNIVVLLSTLAAFVSANASDAEEGVNKRQIPVIGGGTAVGMLTAAIGMGGKVNAVVGAAPEVAKLKATTTGATRVKVRYGPYQIPNMNSGVVGLGVEREGGMMWNVPDNNVKKPCTDCTITYMHAGLELPDGTNANTQNGLWLHHMVAINIGSGLKDATCASRGVSLPHMDVQTMPGVSERFFSSGNERTVINLLGADGIKAGYYVKSGDKFSFIVDLMNMNKEDKKVYMTITYEYLPGKPAGYKNVRPVWFDVAQCGFSDVSPRSTTQYSITSGNWAANFDGDIIETAGHLHDGGTHLEVIRNNAVACNSKATYGGSKEYETPKMNGMDMSSSMGPTHISNMSTCYKFGKVNKGQIWKVKGYYDYTKYPAMMTKTGKPADVMAIAIMYVAVPHDSTR